MKRIALILTIVFTVFQLLTTVNEVSAETSQDFTNLSSFFSLPPGLAENWSLVPIPANLPSGRSAFMYSRKKIIDNDGVSVSPKATFIFEQVPPIPANLDAETLSNYVIFYSMNVRTRWTIPTKIDKVYGYGDNIFSWKKAIGYKARYNDGIEHTILLVHGLFDDNGRTYGVQVIMDSTTSVFPKVESEFTAMLAHIGVGQ